MVTTPSYGSACGIDYLVKNYLKWQAIQLICYSFKSSSTEWPLMTIDKWRIAYKQLYAFSRHNELNDSKMYF